MSFSPFMVSEFKPSHCGMLRRVGGNLKILAFELADNLRV